MSRRVKIKICGLTREEDAIAAAQAGADFLGYIFFPKSKRFIAPERAGAIVSRIRKEFPHVQHVGVFVDESVDEISASVKTGGMDFAQLHGSETPEMCRELKARGMKLIKVFRFGVGAPPVVWTDFSADYFMCDTFDTGAAGGTGRRFDLSLTPKDFPFDRAFLAGGVNAENAMAMIEAVHPFAIDVSSGVEIAPGIKSSDLIGKLLGSVR